MMGLGYLYVSSSSLSMVLRPTMYLGVLSSPSSRKSPILAAMCLEAASALAAKLFDFFLAAAFCASGLVAPSSLALLEMGDSTTLKSLAHGILFARAMVPVATSGLPST